MGGVEADLCSRFRKAVAPDRPPTVSVRGDGSSAASDSDGEKVSRQASFVYYLSISTPASIIYHSPSVHLSAANLLITRLVGPVAHTRSSYYDLCAKMSTGYSITV